MLRFLLMSLFTLFSLLPLSLVAQAGDDLEITDAWVREPIPGRMMSAAYLSITNPSDSDRILTSASADWAGLIEIHTHIHEDGVMRMRQLQSLTIPAGETVTLEPGGLHLMLFRLRLPLADALDMTLCFEDDECQLISAKVRVP